MRRGIAVTVVELLPAVHVRHGPRVRRAGQGAPGIARGEGAHGDRGHRGAPRIRGGAAHRRQADPGGASSLVSVGVRPELALVKQAGLAIGKTGGLLVDEYLRTSDPSIWAAGDMNEIVHKVSGRKARVPLAGPANRQGRIAASNALGMPMKYAGALASSVLKVFDATAAFTGLTESAAKEAGFDVGAAVVVRDHHAGYFPGAKGLVLKLVYDRSTARLLGAQAFGEEGVEKRIDALAVALQGKLTLHDLAEIDLSYAPPYSSANDPINMAAFVGENDISGYSPLMTAPQLKCLLAKTEQERPVVLDVRNLNEYEGSHMQGRAEYRRGRAALQAGGGAARKADRRALQIGVPLAPGAAHPEGKWMDRSAQLDRRVRDNHGTRRF